MSCNIQILMSANLKCYVIRKY